MAITNASYANMPYWGLLPMGMWNYGGDIQVCPVEPYQGYQVCMTFNPIAQQSWGIQGIYNTPITPQVNTERAAATAGKFLTDTYNQWASQDINTATANIENCKTRLNAALEDSNISEDDKNKIRDLIAKLEEQEQKLKELKESQNLNPQEAYQKAQEITRNVNEIIKLSSSLLTGIQSSISSSSSTSTTDTTGTTGSTSSTSSTSTTATTQGSVDEFDNETQLAVEQLFEAMEGLGTDNETLESILDTVDKDNVMDLMLCWNKYKSGNHNESFMETFMHDANRSQKLKYGKQIALALRQKADELGIYDECKEDFAKIDKEMHSWIYVDNDVYQNYDNIIKRIAQAMGSNYGSPSGKGGE